MMMKTLHLKERLNANESFSLPGVFDPFSARIAESLGFELLYMTGYGVNASLLGMADAGFASYREMVGRLQAITGVTDTMIVADGDTGFGGLANVELAARGYEAAGAQAIQIEDQEYPKRCGHTRNRRVVSIEDMVKKVTIATESRRSTDFMIIARTDALAEEGLDAALHRAEAYLEAGADILFVESPESEEQMRAIADRFADVPLVANMVAGGRTPVLDDQALFEIGFQLVLHPVYLLGAALSGIEQAGRDLRESGKERLVADIDRLNSLMGFEEIWALDDRFGD
jgi:2-methylisocitrate lyase-like PEP mutase family enzyme